MSDLTLNIEKLRVLSEAFGPSGFEDEVRKVILDELRALDLELDVKIDMLGNIIAIHKKEDAKRTVILDAHIDEVGFLITHISRDGFLFFEFLGGIDDRILPSQRVVLRGNKGDIFGIIGSKPPHLLDPSESKNVIPHRKLFIDIGAKSRSEVYEMGIEEGTPAVFFSPFIVQGNRLIGKAFDDRVGVFLILELLKEIENVPVNIVAVFSTQEEVGLRGARVVSQNIEADYAIALECTAAGDTPGVPEQDMSTRLGKGPAITIADRATISHPALVHRFVEIARREGIPYQFKGRVVGGTDAAAYRYSRLAIPSITISVPARYIHSAHSIADKSDIESTISLVTQFLIDIAER